MGMHVFLLLALASFAAGVALRSVHTLSFDFTVLGIVVSIGLALLAYIHKERRWFVVALVVCAFSLGVLRMDVAVPSLEQSVTAGEVSFVGTIAQEPEARGQYRQVIVETDTLPYNVLVRAPLYFEGTYKDVVHVQGVLEEVRNFSGDGGRVFNYRGYLAKNNIHGIVSFPEAEVLQTEAAPLEFILETKHAYLKALTQTLPEPSAALAGGITVGERRSLGDELTEDFRVTGLIHIVVLSGYNIAIVILFVNTILAFLPDRARLVFAVGSILAFTFLVGASATVVRAAIMGSIAAAGTLLARPYSALYTLALAGFAMVMWNPYVIVFDPSFQLSFIATLGLLLGTPLLVPKLRFIPEIFSLRELAGATISTYIAVLPLLAYMIGDVSVVSLPMNLLVLPVVPLAMLFVFITGVVGALSTIAAAPFAFVAHILLSYIVSLVEIVGGIPQASVAVPQFSFLFVVAAYAALLLLFFVAKRRYGVALGAPLGD